MLDVRIDGARVLRPAGSTEPGSIGAEDGRLRIGVEGLPARRVVDGAGLLLAPGIVDIHGDAFERQIMPRPGVGFDVALALADTDRQLVANGITTAYHGVTYSWEPGLRGRGTCLAILEALERLSGKLACDTRFHLRFETFNLDGVDDVTAWIGDRRLGILAFNDHAREIAGHVRSESSKKAAVYVERTGLDRDALRDLVERIVARAGEVPSAVASLASHASACGVAMLSHDDPDPQTRLAYRAIGCHVAEFPETEATARTARDGGEAVVMGAPNVVRGGSHNGSINAAEMVKAGLCDVLASDYYYPAQLMAAFKLARDGRLDLAAAWGLISANAARAAGLDDRGTIADGRRADLVLVDDGDGHLPRVVATIVAGRTAYLADGDLIAS
jgi:alpha-D-ribose 1-methylphosphonate 5-triphosphate diphosphatase